MKKCWFGHRWVLKPRRSLFMDGLIYEHICSRCGVVKGRHG